MNIECGVVSKIEGGDVLVEAPAGEQCSHCSMEGSCAMGNTERVRVLRMHNGIGARAGDRVEFSIQVKTMIFASVLLYLFPVLLLMAGAVLGAAWIIPGLDKDLSAAVTGFAGFLISLAVIRTVSKRLKSSKTMVPVLLSILTDSGEKKE